MSGGIWTKIDDLVVFEEKCQSGYCLKVTMENRDKAIVLNIVQAQKLGQSLLAWADYIKEANALRLEAIKKDKIHKKNLNYCPNCGLDLLRTEVF